MNIIQRKGKKQYIKARTTYRSLSQVMGGNRVKTVKYMNFYL